MTDRVRYDYTIRLVKVPESGVHECSGRIVSVISGTRNPESETWYLTALVERPHKEN